MLMCVVWRPWRPSNHNLSARVGPRSAAGEALTAEVGASIGQIITRIGNRIEGVEVDFNNNIGTQETLDATYNKSRHPSMEKPALTMVDFPSREMPMAGTATFVEAQVAPLAVRTTITSTPIAHSTRVNPQTETKSAQNVMGSTAPHVVSLCPGAITTATETGSRPQQGKCLSLSHQTLHLMMRIWNGIFKIRFC